jgi:hypothetical protein
MTLATGTSGLPAPSQAPLPRPVAWRGVGRCVLRSATLLLRRELRLPRENVGRVLLFADGSSARVYRETVRTGATRDPCVLVVGFRLRFVRGRGHAWFRVESILNTPLFAGFPGFASKLWMAHDGHGTYRGVYEWDGAERAERYARSLWRVLELGCEDGSIGFRVLPGLRRDAVIEDPSLLDGLVPEEPDAWWRIVGER